MVYKLIASNGLKIGKREKYSCKRFLWALEGLISKYDIWSDLVAVT